MDSVLLANKYKVLSKLGKGGFGIVYQVMDTITGQHFAMKMEKLESGKNSTLGKEIEIINQLKGTEGVFNVYDAGVEEEFQWVVIDLLGHSLQRLFSQIKQASNSKFKTIMRIGIQMVSRLESLHGKGYVHRDIKPQNFVFGLSNKNYLYLVDFGLCKLYVDPKSKKQLPMTLGHPFVGTPYFASRSAHIGKYQYRKDDLESVCYVLIYLLNGVLPWHKIYENKKQSQNKLNSDRLGDMKCEIGSEALCFGLPNEFKMFVDHIMGLGAYVKPEYGSLRSLLRAMIENDGCEEQKIETLIGTQQNNQLTSMLRNKIK